MMESDMSKVAKSAGVPAIASSGAVATEAAGLDASRSAKAPAAHGAYCSEPARTELAAEAAADIGLIVRHLLSAGDVDPTVSRSLLHRICQLADGCLASITDSAEDPDELRHALYPGLNGWQA